MKARLSSIEREARGAGGYPLNTRKDAKGKRTAREGVKRGGQIQRFLLYNIETSAILPATMK